MPFGISYRRRGADFKREFTFRQCRQLLVVTDHREEEKTEVHVSAGPFDGVDRDPKSWKGISFTRRVGRTPVTETRQECEIVQCAYSSNFDCRVS